MTRDIYDMVHLRWRTAQLMRAIVDGDGAQVRALREVMRVEGVDNPDMCDEFRLLIAEFGDRNPVYLSEEVSRLWCKLTERCVRCGGRAGGFFVPHDAEVCLDNFGICSRCVLDDEEAS